MAFSGAKERKQNQSLFRARGCWNACSSAWLRCSLLLRAWYATRRRLCASEMKLISTGRKRGQCVRDMKETSPHVYTNTHNGMRVGRYTETKKQSKKKGQSALLFPSLFSGPLLTLACDVDKIVAKGANLGIHFALEGVGSGQIRLYHMIKTKIMAAAINGTMHFHLPRLLPAASCAKRPEAPSGWRCGPYPFRRTAWKRNVKAQMTARLSSTSSDPTIIAFLPSKAQLPVLSVDDVFLSLAGRAPDRSVLSPYHCLYLSLSPLSLSLFLLP